MRNLLLLAGILTILGCEEPLPPPGPSDIPVYRDSLVAYDRTPGAAYHRIKLLAKHLPGAPDTLWDLRDRRHLSRTARSACAGGRVAERGYPIVTGT